MPSNQKLLTAAAGSAGGDPVYVEDVFSTYIYMGNDGTNQIINGIDLSGEGGMVWQKARSTYVADHLLTDSVRGINGIIKSNTTAAQVTANSTHFQSWNNNGFTLGSGFTAYENFSGIVDGIVSWSFRKAEKFFDIQTWTGNDVQGREISHALGSTPGCIICKDLTNASANWIVYNSGTGATKATYLNTTDSAVTASLFWDDTAPTDSVFTIGDFSSINASGRNYVAYLFASDAGGFGDDGDENIVKCGSYTGNGTVGREVNLGFEPQWFLVKPNASDGWYLFDSVRGWSDSLAAAIRPNTNDEEGNGFYYLPINATGIAFNASSGGALNANGTEYIYVAIRRGPMKIPEDATKVFAVDQGGNAGSATVMAYTAGFPVDAAFHTRTEANQNRFWSGRLVGAKYLLSESNAAAVANTAWTFDSNTQYFNDYATTTSYAYMFQRAPGFMDVVCYSGTNGTISRNHNLTVAPELMIFKRRNSTSAWTVLSELDGSSYSEMALNSTIDKSTRNYSANQYLTAQPTATVFAQAAGYDNVSGGTYIAYLFATLAGVSKVGSYTGNAGYAVNVDCGFSAGAKFILIKRTNSSGDWYVYDTVRGIGSGNDPYFFLNDTAAQVTNTNYIASLSSGFTVTASAPAGLNASSGNYIFLAIA